MGPAATGPAGIPVAGGPTQGPAGFANLMSGRSTFGGKKRRRTTSASHAMSEAQEGKVSGLAMIECACVCVLSLPE